MRQIDSNNIRLPYKKATGQEQPNNIRPYKRGSTFSTCLV